MTNKTLLEIAQECTRKNLPNTEAIEHFDSLLSQATYGLESESKKRILSQKAAIFYPALDLRFLEKPGRKLEFSFTVRGFYDLKYEVDLSLPYFAVYSLKDPYFGVSGTFETSSRSDKDVFTQNSFANIKPILPDNINDHLLNAIRTGVPTQYTYKHNSWDRQLSYSARCEFTGLIPEKVKSKIEEARPFFRDNIFLIREAKNWDFVKNARASNDPLVIGTIRDQSYLIDSFDCTPIEMEVKEEFKTS